MNTRRIASRLIGMLTIAVLAGCGGETKVEVVKPFRPQYEAFQKQLAQMAANEPKGPVRPAAPLDPKPVLKGNKPDSNTAVFMFDQLRDPRAGLSKVIPMDPDLSRRVLT